VIPASVQSLIDLLASRVGERYVLGARVPKDNAAWHGPWDCAELATWAVYRVTGRLHGVADPTDPPATADAYSGHWADEARLDPVACMPIGDGLMLPGVILIRAPVATGRSGHVAISTGNGDTIEAYDSKKGVIRSRGSGRRWDYAYRVPGITYGELRATYRYQPPPVVREGAKGLGVEMLQDALLKAGYTPGPIDGIFGPKTTDAVILFQRSRGLVPDGEVGERTLRALGL
jgi:N-acetylmuramoyl-L-alanine amidase